MGLSRGLLAFLALAPLVLLTDRTAAAAGPMKGIRQVSPEVLYGPLHQNEAGRYVQDLCPQGQQLTCLARRVMPKGWQPGMEIVPEATATGMAPSDLIAAYKVPSNTAAHGKIVAILDSPDSKAFSDLTAYRKNYGLPTIPKCSGLPDGKTTCFAQVAEDGSASTGTDSGNADGETSLDMDMISGVCPDCAILLVELTSLNTPDIQAGVQTAAKLGAVATSISLGGPEGTDPTGGGQTSMDPTGYTTPGHLVLAASGDFAYNNNDLGASAGQGSQSPSYPSSAPDIISVGGTNLIKNGSSYEEAVWNDGTFQVCVNASCPGQDVTTSGCSTEFAQPSWQATALKSSGCSKRGTADFAAAATFDDGTGPVAIAVYQGGWQQVEGTSASSPIMAALLTRLGLTDQISANIGWIYQNTSAFNDLGSAAYPVSSKGTNTDAQDPASCGVLCTAGPGWDGPSGVGTPDGAKLVALAGQPSTPDAGPGPGVDGGPGSGSDGGGGPFDAGSKGSGSDGGVITPPPPSGFDGGGTTVDAGNLQQLEAGTGDPFSPTGQSSGCGCATPGSSGPLGGGGAAALGFGLAVAALARRRKA